MKFIWGLIICAVFVSCSESDKEVVLDEFAFGIGGPTFDEGYDLDLTPENDIVLTGIFSNQ